MARKVKPIPEGYHAVTPYLSVKGAAGAIEFYKKAFGAKEVMRMPGPDGNVGHAEIQIGDSRIMLADEYPDMNFRGPRSIFISMWRMPTRLRTRRWPRARNF